MTSLAFKKAVKTGSRLRLAFIGPAGSGKTYSSLAVATSLGKRVAVIDTERGSASKYADEFDFDVLELASFSPDTYVQAIHAAEREGYDVIVVDSLSHAWMGKDGALEMVDQQARREKGNSFGAWRSVTPKHNAMVDALAACRSHLIVTMRSKTDWVVEEVNGKRAPRKIGLAPVQRDGLEYEFDVVGDMDQDNQFAISKSRCPQLSGKVIDKPGRQFAETLSGWLEGAPLRPTEPTVDPDGELVAELEASILLAKGQGPAALDSLTERLRSMPESPAKAKLRGVFAKAMQEARKIAEKAERARAKRTGEFAVPPTSQSSQSDDHASGRGSHEDGPTSQTTSHPSEAWHSDELPNMDDGSWYEGPAGSGGADGRAR